MVIPELFYPPTDNDSMGHRTVDSHEPAFEARENADSYVTHDAYESLYPGVNSPAVQQGIVDEDVGGVIQGGTARIFCEWGGCGHDLGVKITVPIIRAHFNTMHPEVMRVGEWPCQWSICNILLKHSSICKHIGNSHLGAGRRRCERCGRVLSTNDAWRRHQENNCHASENLVS